MYNSTKPYKGQILELIKKTWTTPYVDVTGESYPIIRRRFFHIHETDHTDGIGTKGVYHWEQRTFRNAVLDALAMNLNDLALSRAIPYKLTDHIMVPKDDREAIIEIVEALTDECIRRDIAITAGETSVHNNIEGLEIGLHIDGFIQRVKANKFEIGDNLIGIRSNGLHSNGFTKVREVFPKVYREEFVRPTRIYLDEIVPFYDIINGMMHITGGAFTKLNDLLVEEDIELTMPEPQQIFRDLHDKGISDEEMYKTFNCGIGFILSVPKEETAKVVNELEDSLVIGEVIPGNGKVRIKSRFGNALVEF